MDAATLFDKHCATFERARVACRERHAWSPFPEMPNKYPDAASAQARGLAAFQAQLGRAFALEQPGRLGELGEEVSPYTQEPLGITYPRADIEALFEAAERAIPHWAAAAARTRIGVLMEAVDRLYRDDLFAISRR